MATIVICLILVVICIVGIRSKMCIRDRYMVPYLVIGYDILRKAGKGILNRQVFDENFLMAVATVGAIALGDYTEGVSVMLFYQIGELFQSLSLIHI